MVYQPQLERSMTAYTDGQALAGFGRLHQQGLRHRFWGRLTRHPSTLLNLYDVQKHMTVYARSHSGVRLVPIDQIRGSEGRCGDFDADFRALKNYSQARWISIFLARQRDVVLPLVEL
jgi:hypothetical protein